MAWHGMAWHGVMMLKPVKMTKTKTKTKMKMKRTKKHLAGLRGVEVGFGLVRRPEALDVVELLRDAHDKGAPWLEEEGEAEAEQHLVIDDFKLDEAAVEFVPDGVDLVRHGRLGRGPVFAGVLNVPRVLPSVDHSGQRGPIHPVVVDVVLCRPQQVISGEFRTGIVGRTDVTNVR